MGARSLVKITVPLAAEIPLGTSAMWNAAFSKVIRPLICGSLNEPRTVASVVTAPEETRSLLKSCRKPRSSRPSTRRSSGFFCSVDTRPERLRSGPRPTRCALSTVTVELAKRTTIGPEFFNVSASLLELRNAQFGLHRFPVQRRPLDAQHAFHGTRESCRVRALRRRQPWLQARQIHLRKTQCGGAGILATQPPLAIARHHRARHG